MLLSIKLSETYTFSTYDELNMHINDNNQLKYDITVVTHHCKGECLHDHLLLIF